MHVIVQALNGKHGTGKISKNVRKGFQCDLNNLETRGVDRAVRRATKPLSNAKRAMNKYFTVTECWDEKKLVAQLVTRAKTPRMDAKTPRKIWMVLI